MSVHLSEFSRKIADVEKSISQALEGFPADEKLFAVRDLLLAQLRVCALHYKLMELEKDGRVLLPDESSSLLMNTHLELSRFFRNLPKSEKKPTYEMESIMSLYALTAHHFKDDIT